MKILNAIHAQGIGGVDQVFRNYTEVLTKNGHDVALLISKNGHENYQAKKVFKLTNSSQVTDFLKLILILWKFRPDVVICHSNRLMKWARIWRFFSRAKSVAVNHGISFKSSLNCDFVININQQISDLVVSAGFDSAKSFVLPNVIKVSQSFIEKKVGNPVVIGMYGRIEPRKGFDILLKAAAILRDQGFDFILKIGGFEVPGSYNWQSLNNLAKELKIDQKCNFVGTVIDKEKFFSDVDIFCVPSREEPFGLVILEGFLFSTLVVSSNTDGGKLLIKDSENGLIFNNEDPQDLARKIVSIINDLKKYQDITKSAFLGLEKDFSFASLQQKIEEILKKICA